MSNTQHPFKFDRREMVVIFSLFVFTSLLMFTVGIGSPQHFARPIVGAERVVLRQLTALVADASRTSQVVLAATVVVVLGVVLHGAITEMDNPLLPILTGLHHLLLSSPPTLHRLVAWHLVL